MKTRTRGITIMRTKYTVNDKGEKTSKKEYLRCRVNAAFPNNHRMITVEQA